VQARQHVVRQRGQAAATISHDDAFPPVARDFGFEQQFLHDVFFIAVGHCSGGRSGKGIRTSNAVRNEAFLAPFVDPGRF